jgi:hypothetical protein
VAYKRILVPSITLRGVKNIHFSKVIKYITVWPKWEVAMAEDNSGTAGESSQVTRRKALRSAGGFATGAGLLATASGSASAHNYWLHRLGHKCEKYCDYIEIDGTSTKYQIEGDIYMFGIKITRFEVDWSQGSYTKSYSYSDDCGNAVSGSWTVKVDMHDDDSATLTGAVGYDYEGYDSDSASGSIDLERPD